MPLLYEKIKENTFVILPVVVLVSLLHFTFIPLNTLDYIRFLIAAIFIVVGLSFFLVGVDLGVTPLGNQTGLAIIKPNRLWIILIAGLILGFAISIAEPGLLVFANQVMVVTEAQIQAIQIVVWVSVGLAIMVALGFTRIIYQLSLPIILAVLYGIVLVFSLFVSPEYLAISFDAAGATTGIIAVPFLLALSTGVSRLARKQTGPNNDAAFGLVSIASSGAIVSLLILGLFQKNMHFADTIDWGAIPSNGLFAPFVAIFGSVLKESFMALLPLVVVLIVFQLWIFKLPRRPFVRIVKGFIYSFLGLYIFLIGANGGFMQVGATLGTRLIALDSKVLLIVVAFVLGFLTIIAEPAVSVLTHQVEEVTSGYVRRRMVLGAIALGVGIAIALSVIKILVPGLQLWHILLSGYAIALGLMVFTPKLFVGIAFDAGGVATGPLTATFTLAFVQGIANAYPTASVVNDGFGMIALVALAPIITLQLLGMMYKMKTKKRGVSQ